MRIVGPESTLFEGHRTSKMPFQPRAILDTAGPRRRTAWIGLAGVTALFVIAILLVPSMAPAPTVANSRVTTSETIPPWNTWTCNPPNLSPTALSIPVANPSHSRSPGAVLGAAYEFKVENYHSYDNGIIVYLPSTQAIFPTTQGGKLLLAIAPANVTISSQWWTAPALLSGNMTLSTKATFSSSSAYLSSSKYAVMADVASGFLTLEFRWHWTVTSVIGGPVDKGPWSVPSLNATSDYLPSIFYPAPYVGVVSMTSSPAAAGTNFSLLLNAAVANTSFRMVLEYPNNGTEIQSDWENTTVGTTLFNSTVPLAYQGWAQLLPAGSYLIHVHDVCGAIVHMQSVTVIHGVLGAPVRLASRLTTLA
jgi:hypothetical protein